MTDSINELMNQIITFRDMRNWKQFHNPKDLSISIALEAAELLEIFQWTGSNTEIDTEEKLVKVKEELADVLIYSFLLGHDLGLNIPSIVMEKLAENNRKYPVKQAYGRADKYTAYLSEVVSGEEEA